MTNIIDKTAVIMKIILLLSAIMTSVTTFASYEASIKSFNGNIGIGTTSPSQKLEVAGTVSASVLQVNGAATASSFSGAGTGLTGTAASLTAGNATTATNLSGGSISGTTASITDRYIDKTGLVMPVGSVQAYVGVADPSGWLICNGRSLLRTSYSDLFAVMGTAYGAADGTHFNIPDMRGRFVRGTDDPDGAGSNFSAAGSDPDAASRTAANTGGNTGNNVGSSQTDELKSHTHTTDWKTGFGGAGSPDTSFVRYGHVGNAATDSGSMQSTGGNETRPKNINFNYIIKY